MSAARAIATFLLVVAALSIGACGAKGPRVDAATIYTGPEARMEATDRSHVVVFSAPTGGWRVNLEGHEDKFDVRRAFITLRRPAPDRMVTQAIVEHHIDTAVPLAQNVEVYARVLEEEATGKGVGYKFAARAEATRSVTTPAAPR